MAGLRVRMLLAGAANAAGARFAAVVDVVDVLLGERSALLCAAPLFHSALPRSNAADGTRV